MASPKKSPHYNRRRRRPSSSPTQKKVVTPRKSPSPKKSPRKSLSPTRAEHYQHVTRRGANKPMPLAEIMEDLPIALANAELLAMKQAAYRKRKHHARHVRV